MPKKYIIIKIDNVYRVIDVPRERLKGSYRDLLSARRAVLGFLREDCCNHLRLSNEISACCKLCQETFLSIF